MSSQRRAGFHTHSQRSRSVASHHAAPRASRWFYRVRGSTLVASPPFGPVASLADHARVCLVRNLHLLRDDGLDNIPEHILSELASILHRCDLMSARAMQLLGRYHKYRSPDFMLKILFVRLPSDTYEERMPGSLVVEVPFDHVLEKLDYNPQECLSSVQLVDTFVDGRHFQALGKMRNLTTLALQNCQLDYDTLARRMGNQYEAGQFPALKALVIMDPRERWTSALLARLHNVHPLQVVCVCPTRRISGAPRISDTRGWKRISSASLFVDEPRSCDCSEDEQAANHMSGQYCQAMYTTRRLQPISEDVTLHHTLLPCCSISIQNACRQSIQLSDPQVHANIGQEPHQVMTLDGCSSMLEVFVRDKSWSPRVPVAVAEDSGLQGTPAAQRKPRLKRKAGEAFSDLLKLDL
ncbi:hypothetical protein KVT40_001871 [Elsinoe batatas]|uniref:Uncharacterized protein n=1 Tax=Elsinoe batatas TaxID=2601811 RepID=A0A8K0L7A5_9PEZI|nr:hypothetical protein KVT40_001871 [Elsinoe batatas]